MDEVKSATTGIMDSSNSALASAQAAATGSTRTKNYAKTSSNASGTDYFEGGDTWVGEAGPEIRRFPKGTQILSNAASKALTSGGDTYIMQVNARDVKEFNDMVRIFSNYKQAVVQGVVPIG
jgi:phage-related tail protein